MADLTIAVDDRIFTTNEPIGNDEDGSASRTFVSVSLFPLAEFVAANWWPLLHEPLEKEKLLQDTESFRRRHWIDRHTDGFAYPSIGFFGADTSIRIVARVSRIDHADIQFPVTSGTTASRWEGIERSDVETPLLGFLAATASRLAPGQDRHWLEDLIERIRRSRAHADEAAYCRCAGLLGADPYAPGDALETAITDTVATLGEEVAMELFATAQADTVAEKASWIDRQTRSAIRTSQTIASHAHGLKEDLDNAIRPDRRPWDRGYDTARRLRALLGIAPDQPLPTLDAVAAALLGADSDTTSAIENMESLCGARGIAREDAQGLGIAIDRRAGRSAQFQLASTFADFLFSATGGIFLTTRASTDRQKCNRAFAAEFLAPIEGITEKLSPRKSLDANVEQIAQDFGVSDYIVRYQLQNQAPEALGAFLPSP